MTAHAEHPRTGVATPISVYAVAGATLLVLLPLLPTLPGAARSTGEAADYDPAVAHLLVLALAAICVLLSAWAARRESRDGEPFPPQGRGELPREAALGPLSIALLAAAMIVVYFPPFLSPFGPYLEDSYFLSVLHRMSAGQRPFVDFEFQYGPLMIYPLWGWVRGLGFSLQSYYAYLAGIEALQIAALAVFVNRTVPARRARLFALLMLVVVLFNDNLGVSWNGWRRIAPVFILAILSAGRASTKHLAAVAVLLGALVAYSPEYGGACAIATLVVFGALFVQRPCTPVVVRAFAVSLGAVATWLAILAGLLGNDVRAYLVSTVEIVARRAGGEAGFAFAWSLHSLAVYALLFLACAVLGRGLRYLRKRPFQSGDLLLVGGVVYAIVALKSGLGRADMYHLTVPVLVLMVLYVIPFPHTLFPLPATRRAGLVLAVVVAATYFVGFAGAGRLFAARWVGGAKHVLLEGGEPHEPFPLTTAGPLLETETTRRDADLLAAAAYLASPERRERPVVYYADTWGLDKFIGVPKSTYPTDDYLMSDDLGVEIRTFLEERPNALVLMSEAAYAHVFEGHDPSPGNNFYWPLRSRRLGRGLALVSGTHFGPSVMDEVGRKLDRWNRTVGFYVRQRYRVDRRFGRLLILQRADDSLF